MASEAREASLMAVAEAQAAGVSQKRGAQALGLSARTLQRWQRAGAPPRRRGGNPRPWNALLPEEHGLIVAAVARRDLADGSCRMLAFWVLEHAGRYVSHVAVWRYLHAQGASAPRGRCRGEPVGAKPDTVFAQRPNTLWCWDITHLRTTQPWVFLYLYVLLDWVSRKVIAWHLAETLESREVLTLWDRGLQDEGLLELPQHVYPRSLSDRGTQMRSRLTRRFFARTGVAALYARPRTPNDNPEIEAFFSTLKGRLTYPGRFESWEHAQAWCAEFFRWYNDEHHHSSLGFVTPAQRHAGLHTQVLAERAAVKAQCLAERRAHNIQTLAAIRAEAATSVA
jgi:transposase InsO family protein